MDALKLLIYTTTFGKKLISWTRNYILMFFRWVFSGGYFMIIFLYMQIEPFTKQAQCFAAPDTYSVIIIFHQTIWDHPSLAPTTEMVSRLPAAL